jgi:2-polyprenyl-3-methyl-5-hydroxy-6-metoxy-1,4-benzoquinol methylase
MNNSSDLAARYYLDLAAAYVRGKRAATPPLPAEQLVQLSLRQGLRLHRFKRTSTLPRVRKVLGILRGLAPANLLDIGSGRGAFLWPLVDAFPGLPILAIDQKPHRVEDIQAVTAGGFANLSARQMNVCRLELDDRSVDTVTVLEVLEHLPEPEQAAAEIARVASRFVVASVPSREDENPEHIQLFDRSTLERLWLQAGARSVKIEYVLNHIIAVARVGSA